MTSKLTLFPFVSCQNPPACTVCSDMHKRVLREDGRMANPKHTILLTELILGNKKGYLIVLVQ